ncbi:MAG: nucleotidyltransferase domain-containing protein [Melioribacteraceae bacterium]|nr:nucleotidyltransferase domain-containing protein [Melioribacteraceae bacterium]MCF8263884.1 nucleotidyltransferase domain-containing protein [Melioribacteraceae bacterium]MCF8430289.1 nucleotidyltransferase domain-containing protein [Melioribacteraceae bacterium]
MYSRNDLNKLIEKFINRISKDYTIDAAYLFGSYANGTAKEYSDIDLAIVSNMFEGSRFFDRQKLAKYVLETSVDLEIHPYKTEEFTEDDPFVKEIIKTGRKINFNS